MARKGAAGSQNLARIYVFIFKKQQTTLGFESCSSLRGKREEKQLVQGAGREECTWPPTAPPPSPPPAPAPSPAPSPQPAAGETPPPLGAQGGDLTRAANPPRAGLQPVAPELRGSNLPAPAALGAVNRLAGRGRPWPRTRTSRASGRDSCARAGSEPFRDVAWPNDQFLTTSWDASVRPPPSGIHGAVIVSGAVWRAHRPPCSAEPQGQAAEVRGPAGAG